MEREGRMKMPRFVWASLAAASIAWALATTRAATLALLCDLTQYKPALGLTAAVEQDLLVVSWNGQTGAELRARYAIDGGQPAIRDLSIRQAGGRWKMLGHDLVPEYRVTTGVRRMSEQQAQPLRDAPVELTPDVMDQKRWYGFWDAPLILPDSPEMRERQAGRAGPPPTPPVLWPPRTAAEIRRATASFNATSCSVKTDGASVEGTFPG